MRALAWIMFVLVPLGFPGGIAVYFRWKEKNGHLWRPATATQVGSRAASPVQRKR